MRLIDLDKIKPMDFPSVEMDGLDVVRYLATLPTIDAAPVRRGEWVTVRSPDWNGLWVDYELGDKCTACGFEHYGSSIKHYNFCPNCGAQMSRPGNRAIAGGDEP